MCDVARNAKTCLRMNNIGSAVVCSSDGAGPLPELVSTTPIDAGQAQARFRLKLRPKSCLVIPPGVRSAALVAAPCVEGLHMGLVRHPQPRLGRETLVLLRAAGLPENSPKTHQSAQLIASCEYLCTFTSCRRSSPSVSSSLQVAGR